MSSNIRLWWVFKELKGTGGQPLPNDTQPLEHLALHLEKLARFKHLPAPPLPPRSDTHPRQRVGSGWVTQNRSPERW